MTNEIVNKQIEIILPTTIAIVLTISVVIGVWAGDPHWLNRGGAAIAAVSAGAILFQITTELKIEEERKKLEHDAEATENNRSIDTLSPKNNLEVKLIKKRIEHLRTELGRTRIKVVKYVVFSTMFGEFLHGYGDLIMCYLFLNCFIH